MKYLRFLIIGIIFQTFISPVSSQQQDFDFSGNNPDSYQCFDGSGQPDTESPIVKDDLRGFFFCDSNGNGFYNPGEKQAVLRPPKLQAIEVWFVRIIYVVWALVGAYSFYLLVALGYQVLISRGDPTSLPKIRQRIINYMIGFALVFLAIPILDTFFRLLGINKTVSCYDVEMPGFQFFFTSLCSGTDPCSFTAAQIADGIVCPIRNERRSCDNGGQGEVEVFICNPNTQVWSSQGTQ
jgi:hypothetical protein